MTVAGTITPPPGGGEILPMAHPAEAILTVEQLAEWLQVSVRTAEKLPIRSFYVGNRRRYLGQHVLDYIGGQAK